MGERTSTTVERLGKLQRGWFHWHVGSYADSGIDMQAMLHEALKQLKGKRDDRPVRIKVVIELASTPGGDQ